jgi:WD40 repeat protein
LATASGIDVQLWDPQTGQKLPHKPMQHPTAVRDLVFIADNRLVSGDDDAEGNVKVWDTQTGDENTPSQMHHGAPISSLALGPGNLLTTGSLENGSIVLWNITTGERVGALPVGQDTGRWVSDLAFSPDGTRLAVGEVNMGVTTIWDLSGLPNMKAVWTLPNWAPGKDGGSDASTRMLADSVAFSHDGKFLVTGDRYNAAHLWDLGGRSHRTSFLGHTEQVLKVALSPDDSRLATGSADATATIWDAATGRFLFSLSGHDRAISDLAFSPDGNRLATASGDKTVKIWNVARHGDAVNAVAFSPDGKLLATGSGDTTIKIWKTESRELVETLVGHEDRVQGLAFSRDGKFLASVSLDKTTRIWDVSTGKKAPQSTLRFSPNDKFYHVAYSPDGKWLAAAGANKNAVVWDAASGSLLFARPHDDQVSAVAFNSDSTRLVSVGWDGVLNIWDIPSGTLVARVQSPGKVKLLDVRFNPAGDRLVMAATGTPTILTMEAAAREMKPLDSSAVTITAQFTPDGKQILTTGIDSQVRIWDATTGRQVRSLAVHTGKVNDVAFSHDGYWIATASQDGTFTVSPFDRAKLVAAGCTRVGRKLTDGECLEFLGVEKCPSPPPCDSSQP